VRERGAGRTVDIPVAIEGEVLLREAPTGLFGLILDGHVRDDAPIPQPLEELCRAIGGIACEPLRRQAEAVLDALDHGLGDGDLVGTVGARALGVENDADLLSIR
jgi:hypothetical protein